MSQAVYDKHMRLMVVLWYELASHIIPIIVRIAVSKYSRKGRRFKPYTAHTISNPLILNLQ